ncbi:MAG: VOC family protein [Rhodococcus sp. (in: high G+C Gram-positive bacteria)]
MPAPNLFLVYVSDADASTAFYRDLFDLEPVFTSPRYVAFPVAPGVLFAIWTGAGTPDPQARRYSEVALMVPPGDDVDEWFERWSVTEARVVREPHDDVFGRTFVVADPDGNHIRVCPTD